MREDLLLLAPTLGYGFLRRLRHKVTGLQGIYVRIGVLADSRVWLKVLRLL